jgi:probable F420-dependent oxidoreductase
MTTDLPAVGVGLPIVGPHAGPEAIELVATTADRLGFASVGLTERLLLPAGPGWTNDYGLPDWPVLDALEVLSWLAAKTEDVRLTTGVLVPLFQQPIVLARRLATLDRLSGGRVEAGIALGWMPEEFEATGIPARGRAARFEEAIAAMRACWGPDPVEHRGEHYTIPPSKVGPKPSGGTIPLLIGGLAKPAVERAARLGDGFVAAFRNWDDTAEQIAWYRELGGTGRVVLRAGPMLADAEHETPPTTWSEATFLDDLARAGRELGIDELVWDLNIVETPPDRQVEALSALASTLGLQPRQ